MSEFKYTEDELLQKILKEGYKFPISSSDDNLKNKKIDYKVLMLMTFLSNRKTEEDTSEDGKEELWRYLYRNKLVEYQDLVEGISKNKLETIIKTIRKMEKLDCNVINLRKSDKNEIVYDINYSKNGKEYITIETKIMETLIHSFNSNAIKVYVLMKWACRKGEIQLTRSWILEKIGLNNNSGINLRLITNITDELACGGYINKSTKRLSGNKTICKYEVNSLDNWIKIREKNKNRD